MKIPEAELDVLAVLWRCGPLTAAEIRLKLEARRSLTHASVATLIRRLQGRELVVVEDEKQGKAFVFRASNGSNVRKRLAKNFVDSVFDGSGIELMSTLLRSKLPSDDELDELQEILNALRSKNKEKR